jgi:acyl-coenzyme A thioesterase PaaI-like protein
MKNQLFKLMLNVWPPYYGTGIRVRYIAKDFRTVVVEMKLKFYNRNYVGAHFGGSLYSMIDPFYMLMFMKNLGKDYIVWDKAARIEFISPGKGTVQACFKLDDEDIRLIRERTENGERYLPKYRIDIKDNSGNVIARADKTLYVRRKKKKQVH